MKITLNKKQWQEIGKTAGWIQDPSEEQCVRYYNSGYDAYIENKQGSWKVLNPDNKKEGNIFGKAFTDGWEDAKSAKPRRTLLPEVTQQQFPEYLMKQYLNRDLTTTDMIKYFEKYKAQQEQS